MNNEVDVDGGSIETTTNEEQKKGWRNLLERAGKWMTLEDKDKWLDQMRGNLSLVATVIATITFQMALNPPGGVRPIKEESYIHMSVGQIDCTLRGTEVQLCPGEAVLAVIYPHDYFRFLVSNTICFVASLSICLLLVSGISLNHRFPMWLLVIGMCATLTSLAISYTTALTMTTPDPISYKFLIKCVFAWMMLLASIALLHTLRLVIWGVKFWSRRSKKAMTQKITTEIPVC